MHEYDVTLKTLLEASGDVLLPELTGVTVARWLNVELPRVNIPRVDLLGESADGRLVHVEFQSKNDSLMPGRMLEYAARIYNQLGRGARQVVLYIGNAEMNMSSQIDAEGITYRYSMIDVRTLNGEQLLESPHIEGSILAILTRLKDQHRAIRHILKTHREFITGSARTRVGAIVANIGITEA